MPPLTRPVPPENQTNDVLAQFLATIVRNVGGGCNATGSTDQADYGAFSLPCVRATGAAAALDEPPVPRVKGALCLDSGCLFRQSGAGSSSSRHGSGSRSV